MKIRVIDNFLDPLLNEVMFENYLKNEPHYLSAASKNATKETNFYISKLNSKDYLIQYIHYKISKEILKRPTSLLRVYSNIQHKEMDGSFHIDDGDITVLYMLSKTPNNKGGSFEYKDSQGKIKIVPFKQNRLIIFKGIEHRGCGPIDHVPRITVAFKLKLT